MADIRNRGTGEEGVEWRAARLAARRHGVVSRGELEALGMSNAAIVHALAVGRMHTVFRGVFTLGDPRVGRHGRMLAATLACGPGTVVSHRSAAVLLGLWDSDPAVVDVLAPIQSGRKIDGIRRSFVTPLLEGEVVIWEGVPCTSPSRTIVDLAGMVGSASLRRTVERAAALRMLRLAEIDAILARGRRRGSPQLRAILLDWREIDSHFLRSDLEAMLLPLIVAAGLPTPLANHRLSVGGRVMEVDLYWPEWRVVVEADSRKHHGHVAAMERDRDRDRDLTLAGYRPHRVTWRQVTREPTRTVAAIATLLTPH